jgi:hypothetical protein
MDINNKSLLSEKPINGYTENRLICKKTDTMINAMAFLRINLNFGNRIKSAKADRKSLFCILLKVLLF